MPLNLEQPVETLIRPTVVGQQRVNFANWSESDTESSSTSTAEVDGESFSEATAEAESESASASAAWSTEAAASDGRSLNYDGWGTMQLTPRDSSYSRSNTATSGASGSETEGTSASHSSSTAHSTNHATITTESHSHSHSSSRGASEGLEPIYEDLPTAVHSIENARYLAAQKLRSLPAGQAFASFVDAAGLHTTQVNVPLVQAVPVNEATFRRLRALVFARSPSAIATPQAIQRLEGHDAILLEQAQRLPEGCAEPSSFRVPAPRRAKS